jgi:hypothetical protein
LPWTGSWTFGLVFRISMTLHLLVSCVLAILYVASGDDGRLALVLRVNTLYSVITFLWYFVGQVIIWVTFLRRPQMRDRLP